MPDCVEILVTSQCGVGSTTEEQCTLYRSDVAAS